MMKYTKVFTPVLVVSFSLTLLIGGWVYAEESVTQKEDPAVKTVQETQTKLVINGKEISVDPSEGLDVHVDVHVKGSRGKAVVNGKTIAIDTSKGVNLRMTSKTRALKGAGQRQRGPAFIDSRCAPADHRAAAIPVILWSGLETSCRRQIRETSAADSRARCQGEVQAQGKTEKRQVQT